MIMVKIHSTKTARGEAAKLHGQIVAAVKSAMNGPGGFTATARQSLKAENSIASGQLRRVTGGEVETHGDRVLGIVRTENYGPYVEFGTKPHWPPLTAILNWVAQKHIAEVKTGEAFIRDGRLQRKTIGGKWRTATLMGHSDAQDLLARHQGGLKLTAGQLRSARLRVSLGVNREYSGTRNATERAQLKAARAIQFHISKHGTKPHPFMEPGADAAFRKLVTRLREVLGGDA